MMFVAISWFSMFIPLSHMPARVSMAMMALLTLVAMFGSLSFHTPDTSYRTKLDLWMLCCIALVFTSLLHLAILVVLEYQLDFISTPGIFRIVDNGGTLTFAVVFIVFNAVYWYDVLS